jgi:hypothetical protein
MWAMRSTKEQTMANKRLQLTLLAVVLCAISDFLPIEDGEQIARAVVHAPLGHMR